MNTVNTLKINELKVLEGLCFTHRNEEALTKAITMSPQAFDGDNVLIVVGCGGAGKTTSMEVYKDLVSERYYPSCDNPAGQAYVSALAPRPAIGTVRERDCWQQMQTQMNGVKGTVTSGHRTEWDNPQRGRNSRTSDLDAQLITARMLRLQNVPLAIIDEAHNLIIEDNIINITRRADAFKSFAMDSGSKLILCGIHRLLDLVVTGELARRFSFLEMERYRPIGSLNDQSSDHYHYSILVNSIYQSLGYEDLPDLTPHLTEIHEETCGIVGIWVKWLKKAIELATANNIDGLPWKVFNATRPKELERLRAGSDAILGELRIDDPTEFDRRFNRLITQTARAHRKHKLLPWNEIMEISTKPRPGTVYSRLGMLEPENI